MDILSFPKSGLYFLSVCEYPRVWFYHFSGTGQVALGFILCVTDPAGPPLVHLVPAPCQTGEGKQYWMKLREEASVGKQLFSHLLTLKRPARAACRWLLKGTASIRGLREGKSLRRLTEGHWGTEASSQPTDIYLPSQGEGGAQGEGEGERAREGRRESACSNPEL